MNVVLDKDFNRYHAKVISEEAWNYFNNKYPGGFEVKRPIIKI